MHRQERSAELDRAYSLSEFERLPVLVSNLEFLITPWGGGALPAPWLRARHGVFTSMIGSQPSSNTGKRKTCRLPDGTL